ncbi:hypothetical protein QE390_000223 [Siphonobacter sp. SORGH_AS 1065]|nr:hypothetical protein [Siphonobacter sp. SORGH_AS_1065]
MFRPKYVGQDNQDKNKAGQVEGRTHLSGAFESPFNDINHMARNTRVMYFSISHLAGFQVQTAHFQGLYSPL